MDIQDFENASNGVKCYAVVSAPSNSLESDVVRSAAIDNRSEVSAIDPVCFCSTETSVPRSGTVSHFISTSYLGRTVSLHLEDLFGACHRHSYMAIYSSQVLRLVAAGML